MRCDDDNDQKHKQKHPNGVPMTQNNTSKINQRLTGAKNNSKQNLGPSNAYTPPKQQQDTHTKNETPKAPHEDENGDPNDQKEPTLYQYKQQPIGEDVGMEEEKSLHLISSMIPQQEFQTTSPKNTKEKI